MIFLFFREYKYTREIAAAVVQHLQYRGFDAALVTPEEYDVSLRARTERVNTWCRQLDLLHLPWPDSRRPACHLPL